MKCSQPDGTRNKVVHKQMEKSRFLRLILPAVSILLFASPAFPGDLPPKLEKIRIETIGRLGELYGLPEEERNRPIEILIADPSELDQHGWGGLPEYAAGAAHSQAGRLVVIPRRTGDYPFGDEGQTLIHELSHVLLYRALGFRPPRWFDEGLAMRAAGEWGFEDEWHMAFALRKAAQGDYPLSRVEGDFREGESRVRRSYVLARAFVSDLFPESEELTGFIESARAKQSVDKAFTSRYQKTADYVFFEWARERPVWRDWILVITSAKMVWIVALILFLVAAALSYWRKRRKFERLPE